MENNKPKRKHLKTAIELNLPAGLPNCRVLVVPYSIN